MIWRPLYTTSDVVYNVRVGDPEVLKLEEVHACHPGQRSYQLSTPLSDIIYLRIYIASGAKVESLGEMHYIDLAEMVWPSIALLVPTQECRRGTCLQFPLRLTSGVIDCQRSRIYKLCSCRSDHSRVTFCSRSYSLYTVD